VVLDRKDKTMIANISGLIKALKRNLELHHVGYLEAKPSLTKLEDNDN